MGASVYCTAKIKNLKRNQTIAGIGKHVQALHLNVKNVIKSQSKYSSFTHKMLRNGLQ